MTVKTQSIVGRRMQFVAAFAAFTALLAGFAFFSGPGNQAGAAPGQAVQIGALNMKRVPLCPERCSGLAVVSGFQAKAGGIANSYQVPFVGNVTRWRLKLGKPNASQRSFFERRFGTKPQAALGVLAKTKQSGKVVYKLRSRTAIQDLTSLLGKTTTFTPARPLKVNKGDFLALIVPTWAPALAVPRACETVNGAMRNATVCDNFNKANSWVASRDRRTCAQDPSMQNSKAQIKVGSLTSYGCRFNGALTYSVRVDSR